jgi:WD40 repeat protein
MMERRAMDAKIAVSADGKSIFAASLGRSLITEWEFRTGNHIAIRRLPIKDPGEVWELSPDGRWLVTNERSDKEGEQNAVVWDVRAGKIVRKLPFKGDHVIGQRAAFSPDEQKRAIERLITSLEQLTTLTAKHSTNTNVTLITAYLPLRSSPCRRFCRS